MVAGSAAGEEQHGEVRTLERQLSIYVSALLVPQIQIAIDWGCIFAISRLEARMSVMREES